MSNDELLAALRQIKTEWPQTQCIVMVDEEQDHQAAEAAGADIVLMKGVLVSRLYSTVEEMLSR